MQLYQGKGARKTKTAQSEEAYKLECSHAQQKRQGRSANCSPYRKLHQLVDLVPPQSIPEGEALELDDQGVGQPPHGHLLTGLPLLLTAGAVPANTTSRSGNSSRYAHRGMLFSRLNTCTLHLSHRHLLTGLSLLLTAGAVPAKTTSCTGNSSRQAYRGKLFSHLHTHPHTHTHTPPHHTYTHHTHTYPHHTHRAANPSLNVAKSDFKCSNLILSVVCM